ncbi:MFS transporter [Bacillus methanolicus]|uniref:Major facilitator superfamily MFS_1 n=1 Tax=Bacillus methanolicus (strain MGA3 / ATCC 53907) TaxID=796606 RepID=I3EBD1_BACMM|nr:MFS transporter [Bacillus methanolicus]AIE61484.1 major facilitator superfamily MFS_1 [Bacillus methanolicus MGA3]EIJ83802.1 putative transporter [Bacillus methanolicus MGA3]
MNNTWKIYMLTLISFLVGTSQFVIVGILDKVADSVGVSVSVAGQLITVFALANAIGTPVFMMATSKMDRRNQLLLALVIILLGIVSTLALPGFDFLMVSRIVLGVGTGIFVVTAYATAANLALPGRQAGAMSNISLGFSSSLVLGVPIGRVVAAAFDWKVIFWGIGFFTLLGIFAIAKTIPYTKDEEPIPLGKQLALLKNPKVAFALGVTLFVFIAYSVVNTYITPFLTSAISISGRGVSVILFALGIASLFGSKLGGFLADRLGTAQTLIGSMLVQALSLALVSALSGSVVVVISLLMLWTIAAWAFGPTQNFNLLSVAPEASGIILSLNSTFVQLGFAAGAGIGGIAVDSLSILVICWIGAAAVMVALFVAVASLGLTRTYIKIK